MNGPKAPKDPTKKRKGFYVMLEKEIEASVRPNSKPSQEIYLDDGRLTSFAKIVGNITDEKILELLETREGFQKLVHSIGLRVSSEDRNKKVDFALHFYGKKDTYGGGTKIRRELVANDAETIIELDEVEWSADDEKPGMFVFAFDKPQDMAVVSVKFYIQDGYDVPEIEEEIPIPYNTDAYREMIELSLKQKGNNYRIKKAIEKARRGEEITLAYIGGSITQGAGAKPINTNCYAYKSYEAFVKAFAKGNKEKVHYVKAGVGGTPSELGMIRYHRDVLSDGDVKPDIVVVEFAVNDEGDETKGKCYESLVRKILNSENAPAVILLFAVFADDFNLEERLCVVGESYQIPMVSIKSAVVEQFYKKKDQGRIISKNQFFYDRFHPSNDGHTIMADSIQNLFNKIDADAEDEEPDYKDAKVVIGKEFEDVFLVDRRNYAMDAKVEAGGFTEIDEVLQRVERNEDAVATPQFPYNWMHTKASGTASFCMTIKAKTLLLVHKDSGNMEFGKADVYVDGKYVLTADPHINGWDHCNPVLIFCEQPNVEHKIEIKMAEGDEEKCFTILGFGVVC